jgi:Heavy metal associated domain 2
MLPEAYISHLTAGRMRIKIPSRKGDGAFFSALKDYLSKFSEFPGIQKIELNPLTGSMLVIHTLGLNPAYLKLIKADVEQKGLFKIGTSNSSHPSASGNIAENFKNVNKEIIDFTRGELDIRSLALIGLIGLGLFQASRGQFMIPAVSAFWYAATLLKDQPPKDGDQKSKVNNLEV